MSGTLYGVGIGPGDPELITLKAARLIEQSPVVCYIQNLSGESLARRIAAPHLDKGQRELPIAFKMSKDRRQINQAYDQAANIIAETLTNGEDVTMLCEGDPLFFGSFNYVLERLGSQFNVEVVPGINSVQAVAAVTQAPLIMLDQTLAVVSARNNDNQILQALSQHDSVAILKAGPQRERLLKLIRQSGRWQQGCYVTRATQHEEQQYRSLDQVPSEPGDYFGMIIVRPRATHSSTETPDPRPLIVSLTDPGNVLASSLCEKIQGEHWHRPENFQQQIRSAFSSGRRLILICATGIAMRTLAPVLKDKHQDPAVLVLDESGQHVIPLLSGHEGGANQWADEIAALTQGQAIITSARQYLKPIWVAGMGCERNCPEPVLAMLLAQALSKAGLRPGDLSAICSIDVKADENGLIGLAERMQKPYICYPAANLREVEDQLQNPSEVVFKEVGCYGVAEGAALYHAAQLSANGDSELVLAKQKNPQATVAIARAFLE